MRRFASRSYYATLVLNQSCYCSSSGTPPPAPSTFGRDASHPLSSTLENIINKDRMVVFLTGTPSQPRCRFTGATVDMLRQLGIKYSYYDILNDDEICEGLKEYSNWPTYPQVYLDGELIGGFDVCKKMLLDGELTKLLKQKGLL